MRRFLHGNFKPEYYLYLVSVLYQVLNISRYVIESLAVYIGICLFARALRKWVGGADFDIIYLIYLMMGAQNMYIYIFMLLVLCSGLYMLLSKSDRNKRLPLIPVMTAAYVITIFIIRGGVYW